MNYKVATIPVFEKELKRLTKKYQSLKNEFAELVKSLQQQPERGTSLAIAVTKSVFLSLAKEKVKVAELALLLV